MAKAGAKDALALVLERLFTSRQPAQSLRFVNAAPLPGLDQEWRDAFYCVQSFRPDFLALERSGYSVTAKPEDALDGSALFLTSRNRLWNQNSISQLWNSMKPGSMLVVAGGKTDGIASLRKWFAGHVESMETFSKYHSVVFHAVKQHDVKLPEVDIERSHSGYRVAEGMFSSDGPDRGSLLLASHLSNRIRGTVADFGAGWGFLSNELLDATDRVEKLELFEADCHALDAARLNVRSDSTNLAFHWTDITTEFRKRPSTG